MASLTVSNLLGILEEDPNDSDSFERLKELLASGDPEQIGDSPVRLLEAARVGHERRGELRAASWLIELEAELIQDDRDFQAALYKELGRLRREELLDDDGAREAYQRSLELRAGDEEVERTIEDMERASEKWRELADRFTEEANDASDLALKTSMLVRAGSLVWQYGKKGRTKEADRLFTQALEADPSSTRAARLYSETLRIRERWEPMASVLSKTADSARNRNDKLNLYVQAARVLVARLADQERAAACYERVLELKPGQEEALRFLVEYFTEREEWDHLVALYEDALRSRQKLESERGILLQIGMVHWRIRDSIEQAEPYFARLRKIDPSNPGMLDFYREHLRSDADGARLLTILGDALRVATDSDQKLALGVELARTAQDTEHTERAIEAWKSVQRLDQANHEAQKALRELYRQGEKWNALVEVIRAEIDALPAKSTDARVELLRELVAIYRDRLHLDAMVIHTYNSILQEVPGDEEALAQLMQTYESMGRWNDLIQVLGKKADAANEPAAKVELFMRIAGLWIERFANHNQATRPLEEVIRIDPEHREALSRLKEIYSKKRAWKSLYEVMRKEFALTSDNDARLEMTIELAKLAGDRLHNHEDAIRLWREVIEQAPDTPGALESLERLAEREKDWGTLAESLERRVNLQSDSPSNVKVLQKLGSIYSDYLEDPARAAEAWKRILAVDPKNGRALRTLRETYLAAQDWDGLYALYEKADDWEGLVEVLGSAAERTSDEKLKVELSFRAAGVYEDQIGEPHRAFRSYERVLTVDTKNVKAARRLLPIYEKEEKWPRLVVMLEILSEDQASDMEVSERAELLSRLREISLDRLRDSDAALKWAAKAFELAPADEQVRADLEATAEAGGLYETLLSIYLDRIKASEDDEERLRLRRRVASIAGEQLGRFEEAIEQLKSILEVDPTDTEATAVLDRLYRGHERYTDLRDLYKHRLSHATADQERHDLLRELATVEEEMLGDAESAAERYRAILDIYPKDSAALVALDRLATEASRWKELADIVRRRRELSGDDAERAALTLRLGDLYKGRLEDPRAAMDAYADVLRVRDNDGAAIAGLEALYEANSELRLDIGRLLEGAYAARGAYPKLAAILEERLNQSDDADEKRALRLRLAELSSSELGDLSGAFRSLEEAFRERPSDRELWERLSSAAEAAGKHEELTKTFADAVDGGTLSDVDAAELSSRVAELYDVVLAHPDAAEPYHRRVLRHDPLSESSFSALKELFTNGERWDELQKLYRNRIAETVDGEAKLELLLQVCFLFEEILDDPDMAISAYRDVLELSPDHHASRRALERLYRRTERWRDLAELLREELTRAEGQETIELTHELGELHEHRLDEPSAAVDLYERVLEQSPTHLRSQEALERLLQQPSQRQRIASILEPLYDSQGAWTELVRVLEVQLEEVRDPGSRVSVLTRVAELQELKLHDTPAAFRSITRAVEADPADASVRTELDRLAKSCDNQRERARVLERTIEAEDTPAYVRADLLLELACLWDEQENDPEAAARAYSRLIDADGDNAPVVMKASKALERIHLAKEDYDALAEDLRRQIKFEDDGEARSRLLVRLAELLETTLDDLAGAVRAHRQRLEHDPTDREALHALERLYERQGEWPRLVEILRSREEATDDEGEQRQIAHRIGEIYEEKLQDADNAIIAYNDVLARFGQDTSALDALARLYRTGERWTDLLEVVEMKYETVDEEADRARLRFEAAELMRTRTGDVERAIEGYAEVLDGEAGHLGSIAALEDVVENRNGDARIAAARTLVPQYERTSDYNKLVEVLQVVAETDERTDRLQSLRRAAEVADVGLEQPGQAFQLMGRAVQSGLEDDDLAQMLSDYERLAGASDKWADYVKLLDEVAPDILDAELQTDVWMKVASVAAKKLDDRTRARADYEKVLHNRPDHRPALDALESLHQELKDYPALLDVLRRKTELSEDSESRVGLLMRQAEISDEHLHDAPIAIEAYERVLTEGVQPEAFSGLERLYRGNEQWRDLADLFERKLEAGVGDQSETRYQLGLVSFRELNDAYQAIEHFRETLAQDGTHQPTVEALEQMMESEDHRGAAAEILEPVFLSRMDWPKVTGVLEARLSSAADVEERRTLLRRLGQIHEDYLEDLEGAMEVYARLFFEEPLDRDVWDILSRLAKVLDRWPRLAEIYRTALDKISVDDPDSIDLAAITARICDERNNELDHAGALYRRVLRFDSGNASAFEALESIYQRTKSFSSLLELYHDRVEGLDSDQERMDILRRSAALRENELSDVSGAIQAYRHVLDIDPVDADAVHALDRLFTSEKRWEELADHLRTRIDSADSPETDSSETVADLRHRLGSLLAEHLDDSDGAVDLFEEIVQTNPNHQAAVASLEEMVMDEGLRPRITHILEPIYRASDEWKKLIAVLDAQVSLTDEVDTRVRLLTEIGELHENRGHDGARAFRAWAQAFVIDPADTRPRAELDRLAQVLGCWDKHVEAYELAVKETDDTVLVSDLLSSVARVHDEKRGDPRAAIETYERLHGIDADDPAPLEALEGLHTMVGDWRGLVDVLRRKVDRSLDPAERGELHRRAGSVLEELLGDPRGAIEAYRRAADEDQDDQIALEALDRLYGAAGEYESLASILRRRLEGDQDPSQRVELGLRLGALSETQLHRPDDAIDAFVAVIEAHPQHPEAVRSLARLYERQALWSELLDILKLQAEMSESLQERVAFVQRAGEVLERELDDVPEAVETYRAALDLDGRYEPALQALLRITQLEDYRSLASAIVEPRLEVQERWDELTDVLSRKAESETDPYEKCEHLRKLAEVHENGRGDLNAAFDALEQALAEKPSDESIVERMERIAEPLNAWPRFAEVLSLRAANSMEPMVARALYERLARVAEEKLQDQSRAIEAYQRALEQVGDDSSMLAELDRLLGGTQRWSDFASVLERRVSVENEEGDRLGLLLRLGETRQEQLGDLRGAFSAYQEVLELRPSDTRAMESLERLASEQEVGADAVDVLDRAYRDTGDVEKAARLYDVRIRLAETDGERVRLLQEVGEIWERDLNNPSQALETIRRAFELDPRDETLLEDLERLASASQGWESLRGVVERVTELADIDVGVRRDLNVRAAVWYREHIPDAVAEEACLRAALKADPDSMEAHERLVHALREASRNEELVTQLKAWADVQLDEYRRKELLHEAAGVAESALNDKDLASACYESILATDGSDKKALHELSRIRETEGRHDESVVLLAREVGVEADPARRRELQLKIAETYLGELHQPDKAADAYRSVLDDDPTDSEAVSRLESIYEDAKDWDSLRELLDRRLDLADDDDERIGVRVRLARLEEQAFGRRTEAIEQLRGILDLKPNHEAALDELARLFSAEEDWDALTELLGRRLEDAEQAGDTDKQMDLLRQIAKLHVEQRSDPVTAIATYERVLDMEPNDVATLKAIVELHRNAERWDGACDAMERLIDLLPGEEAAATAIDVAEIAESHGGGFERAEAALQRAMELQPSSEPVRSKLVALYEKYQAHESLAALLESVEERTSDVDAKVALLKRLGQLYLQQLNDTEAAARFLERAAEHASEDRDVLLPLCDIYISANRESDAVPVLEKIIASFGSRRNKELARYHHRLGQALAGMDDADGALKHYDAAFKIDLTNVSILRDLGKLCHARGDFERAQKTFRALLLQRLKPEAGITKADVYYYLGDIAHQQGNSTKAASMLERAIAEQKGHPAATELLAQVKG